MTGRERIEIAGGFAAGLVLFYGGASAALGYKLGSPDFRKSEVVSYEPTRVPTAPPDTNYGYDPLKCPGGEPFVDKNVVLQQGQPVLIGENTIEVVFGNLVKTLPSGERVGSGSKALIKTDEAYPTTRTYLVEVGHVWYLDPNKPLGPVGDDPRVHPATVTGWCGDERPYGPYDGEQTENLNP